MPIDGNLDRFLRWMDRVTPSRRVVLRLINNMEYASYLQDRDGIFVFNDEHLRRTVVRELRKAFRAGDFPEVNALENVADAAGTEEINYLRSTTGELAPPVRTAEGRREKHPGGWADRTGNLKNAYRHEVESR